MQSVHVLALGCLFASPLLAQTTWIVNAGGGPGVNFTSLAAAVATAANGDTIVVQFPPMLESVGGFTTDKGLTIVGEGGGVPIVTSTPIVIENLPAGDTFRMAGFSRIGNGTLDLRVLNCAGSVHLENLHAREPDWFFPSGASIEIADSSSVSLRDVETFGLPAVLVRTSTVVLTNCRLGVTQIGLGGGPCLQVGPSATVDVVEPAFDSLGSAIPIGVGGGSTLRVVGSTSSYVRSQHVFTVGYPVVNSVASTVTIDPAVQLLPGAFQPVFTGTAPVPTLQELTGSWCGQAAPGQVLAIHSAAPVGSAVFQVLGRQVVPTPTVFGVLAVDPTLPYLIFGGAITPANGVVDNLLLVPASVPRGETFATQALVFDGVGLTLGAPAVFTVH
jgi:hypothetical protein